MKRAEVGAWPSGRTRLESLLLLEPSPPLVGRRSVCERTVLPAYPLDNLSRTFPHRRFPPSILPLSHPSHLSTPRQSGATLRPTSRDVCRAYLDRGQVWRSRSWKRSKKSYFRLSRSDVRLFVDRRCLADGEQVPLPHVLSGSRNHTI